MDKLFDGLVYLIRTKIRLGRVPRSANARVFCGRGAGYPCACCGRSIRRSESEYEIENDPLDADALYVMHARCYSIWSELVESTYECRQPAGQIDFAPLKQLLARLA